ncbi:hypothetical protein A0H81_14260 [Grifola frondosa]|uniref:Uncharacterized protein n=1 Tax=Grifola frondosa TaxID=5627 RepID=A0A1C7LN55_GRIFR|nr:hypothetical protein A0H81_14260 [Grifola frondosa]
MTPSWFVSSAVDIPLLKLNQNPSFHRHAALRTCSASHELHLKRGTASSPSSFPNVRGHLRDSHRCSASTRHTSSRPEELRKIGRLAMWAWRDIRLYISIGPYRFCLKAGSRRAPVPRA